MKNISVLIKPASSLCNMRCHYCFYADITARRNVKSYGIMKTETAENLIKNILVDSEDFGQVTFAFQGGEPTLAGLSFFEFFVQVVQAEVKALNRKVNINYAFQTNGLVLNDEWCEFFKKNRFLVGLSLDGNATMHNENRVDAKGKGTYSRIMAAKQCLEKHSVEYNILWVLTSQHARYPQKVWNFLIKNSIKYVQFIPCLSELNSEERTIEALTPERFAKFYIGLFQQWKSEMAKGNYISVKFFDDLFNLLMDKTVTACGLTGHCQQHFVVEADGSVYPCDFYTLDSWRVGDFNDQTVGEIATTAHMKSFTTREKNISTKCGSCTWVNMCGGGCPRMKDNMYLTKNEKYCGYEEFLNACSDDIQFMARKLYRNRF